MAGSGQFTRGGSGARYVDPYVHVSASSVRIGTDFLMRFPSERVQFRLREALVLDMKPHGETKPAALAWANADIRRHATVGRVLFVLLSHVIESAPKACGVSGREKMLRRGRVRFPWPTHRLWHRKICANRTVACLRMAIATTGRRCRSSE